MFKREEKGAIGAWPHATIKLRGQLAVSHFPTENVNLNVKNYELFFSNKVGTLQMGDMCPPEKIRPV